MSKKTLPTYYYLDHFREFLDYIQGPCVNLLTGPQHDWLARWYALDKPKQCIIARIANRKHSLIALRSLDYSEIPNWQQHTQLLLDANWLRRFQACDLHHIIPHFTKPELMSLFNTDDSIQISSSTSKAGMVECALSQLTYPHFERTDLLNQYLIRDFDPTLEYFLFMFFGHIKGTLSRFSMRDLGVMRTRKDRAVAQARFTTRAEAQSAFYYANWRRDLHQCKNQLPLRQSLTDLIEAVGSLARQYKDECLWLLGKAYLAVDRDYAMTALALSHGDKAQEKWIRECYKHGDKHSVKLKLEALIDDPPSEELVIFAKDFLARKYHQKRTNQLTDMLQNAPIKLLIDSQHINQVENGVVDFYLRKGIHAVRTENTLWLSLFGLVYWEMIYEEDTRGLANEFDIRSNVLVENRLYQDHAQSIETRLEMLNERDALINFLLKQVSRHYGKVTTLFHWHSRLLDKLMLFLQYSPVARCISMLRIMAKDFHGFKDGFPDIMVIEQEQLRFEEIKAPGDQLRRNQLISLTKLQEVGYRVQITRVEWFRDPMQPYVVVDIETTGGKSGYHRITEIGMVKRINGETVAEWQSLINPLRHIPKHITALTGINNQMVADAPCFAEVADAIEAFTQGCVFVAHNVNFDYGFIKHEFERLDRFYRRPKMCTVREMRKAFPGLKSYSLANLTDYFNIDMQRHHRAMSDANAAAELLQLVHTKLDSTPPSSNLSSG